MWLPTVLAPELRTLHKVLMHRACQQVSNYFNEVSIEFELNDKGVGGKQLWIIHCEEDPVLWLGARLLCGVMEVDEPRQNKRDLINNQDSDNITFSLN